MRPAPPWNGHGIVGPRGSSHVLGSHVGLAVSIDSGRIWLCAGDAAFGLPDFWAEGFSDLKQQLELNSSSLQRGVTV